jgi:hypothetical protein
MSVSHEKFTVALAYLQKMFGKQLDDDVIVVYWGRLSALTDAQFDAAVKNVIDNFTPSAACPFPVPATFLKGCGQDLDSLAQSAIGAIKRAAENHGAYMTVDFGDPALHATINRFGGWPEIARWACQVPNKWDFQERNFIAAYKAARESGDGDGPCAGLFLIENSTKALTDRQKQLVKEEMTPVRVGWSGSNFELEYRDRDEIGDSTSEDERRQEYLRKLPLLQGLEAGMTMPVH